MRANPFSSIACVLVLLACATGEDLGAEGSSSVVSLDGGSKDASLQTGTGGRSGGGGKANTSGGTTTASGGTNGGGTSAGGKASNAGGAKSSGGAVSVDDAGADSGSCEPGTKWCEAVASPDKCSPPAPYIGCGLTGCDPCTMKDPANGFVTCTNNLCDFDCNSGYKKNGSACQAVASGGATGAGGKSGTAGAPAQCNKANCPACNVISGPACCTNDNKCGCPAIPYVSGTCAAPR